jgi:hypothetical protein
MDASITPGTGVTPPADREPTSNRPLIVWALAAVALIALLAVLAGAFFVFKPASAPPAGSGATSPAAVGGLAADAKKLFARQIYLEQIESATNIRRMAGGKITSFDITDRSIAENTSTVGIVAHFVDGSSAAGEIHLVRDNGTWYFFTMEGERSAQSTGIATGVDAPHGPEAEEVSYPDSAIDFGVANEMVRAQAADQQYLKAVAEGPASRFALAKPQPGAGTVSIDADMYSASGGTPKKCRIVMAQSQFEGRPYFFIMGLRPVGQ